MFIQQMKDIVSQYAGDSSHSANIVSTCAPHTKPQTSTCNQDNLSNDLDSLLHTSAPNNNQEATDLSFDVDQDLMSELSAYFDKDKITDPRYW